MVEVDADLSLADGGELPEDDPYEGPSEKGEQRLRDVVRDRLEPLADTGGGEEYIKRYLGHSLNAGVRRQKSGVQKKSWYLSSSWIQAPGF
jgi:hypothetical protein